MGVIKDTFYKMRLKKFDVFESVVPEEKNGKWGFKRKSKNKLYVDYQFDSVKEIGVGYAVQKNGKWGVIDELGFNRLPCVFDEIRMFKNYFAVVKKNGKYGVINDFYKLVIPCVYSEIRDFSDGLFEARKMWDWGFITEYNTVALPFEFESVSTLADGYKKVQKQKKVIYYDRNFKEIDKSYFDKDDLFVKPKLGRIEDIVDY